MKWILLTAVAGICAGSFGLPMKFTTKWRWEHSWSMFALWGLIVLPCLIAIFTIPHLPAIYSNSSWTDLLLVFLFGSCWGIGTLTFGLGLSYLGIGLGYSLMVGLIIIIGSILPMIMAANVKLLAPKCIAVMAGIAVILISVVINSLGAVIKERDISSRASTNQTTKKTFLKGIIICILSGIASPGLNYAFIYGNSLTQAAINSGVSSTVAANAVLPIALMGAGILNLAYCFWLINKAKTWRIYLHKGTGFYFFFTPLMAVETIGIALFGIASANLGNIGPTIGWALINSVAILWANILGVFTSEWKGVSRKTWVIMVFGMITLLIGICIVGWANSLC
ncbi:MAG: hypothetical protein A2Y12_03580 [Planctomycetes bacterium GWF2_42_9]|nr:MAG: hypothetical protein A2Y12_03580 [Planctomycetes bacterium GWF2_42_9]